MATFLRHILLPSPADSSWSARVFAWYLLLSTTLCINVQAGSRPELSARRAVSTSIARTSRAEAGAHQDDAVLVRGAGSEKELAGGQAHTYKIYVAAAQQYLRVVVEQRGIIITATLSDPAGKELVKTDNPSGGYGTVYVSAISESAGDYRLELRSNEAWANAGRYKISLEDLREATPSDRARVAAEKDYADGRRLLERPATANDREDPLKKFRDARKKFEDALTYWQLVADRHWIALTEFCLGVTHRNLGDRRAAAQHFDKSLAVQLDEHDWRLRATVFNDRGVNYSRLGEQQQALESLNEALRIYQSHQDRRGQASALNNIGYLHIGMGRYREASESFNKALPLRRAENDRNNEAALISNIASVADSLGESHAALKGFVEALQVWQELERQEQVRVPVTTLAAGFNNVALAYDRLGEWQQALENYEKALSLFRAAAPVEAAKTLDNIGELYAGLGDARRAMEYYDKAKFLAEGKDPSAEANVLIHIGQVYVSESKLSDALTYFERALPLRKSAPEKANTLTNIGAVYVLQGNPRKALESYNLALKLSEASEDRRGLAITLQKIGEAHALLGEYAQALEDFNRALPLWQRVADKRGEAATLHSIALAERNQRNLPQALSRSQEALNIIESLRTKVASQRLRASYFASQQAHYELYVDLRMRLYQLDKSPVHLAATLEASEQSRARSLVDMLFEARADISRGISEDLVRREREAQQRLNDKARVQMELLNRKHTKEEAAIIEREVNDAIAEYDAVKAKIRANSPTYARLTQPHSLSLREIQQLLDEETLLLEYFLGEERSYLWLVSSNSIIGVDSLPNRAEIENRARVFYQSLTRPQAWQNGTRAGRRSATAISDQSQAAALSQMLLGPVADRLGKKRLLIVGDGVLQYLPFGALPLPARPGGTRLTSPQAARPAAAPYLVEEHEIVYLPAAAALAVLRTETGDRKSAPLSVAVLANPIFDAAAEPLQAAKRSTLPDSKVPTQSDSTADPTKGSILRSGLELVPLPATEKEALAIRDAIPPPGRTKIALGFEASRATVMRLQNEGYRIVHFATHADIDVEHPELSSVVLSMRDAEGRPQDGFLRLHDIYNLKLPADLIVLSACSTGLGRIIKGEGLIGLTRGFMYAGSPRIIASLWRVDDLGTSELMKRFYQHMAKEGRSPSLALRQSQIEMLRGRRWRSPYHWAGFVLQGEWKALR
jgi:CHAT domain-containing protein/Tfp pilus assembly protein PilF